MMKKYTVPRGSHTARPLQLDLIKCDDLLMWQIKFDENSDYVAKKTENQQDWHKVAGFSIDLLTNHRTSFMLGSRWIPEKQVHEIGPYCHIDKGIIVKPEDTFIETVEKEQEFIVLMIPNFENKTVEIQLQTLEFRTINTAVIQAPRIVTTKLWREIWTNYGGDEKAQKPWSVWKYRFPTFK